MINLRTRLNTQFGRRWWAPFAFMIATSALNLWIHPSDVREYQHYAVAALTSPVLHVWPREYPMLSLTVFLLPLLLPLAYRWAFAVLTAAVLAILIWAAREDRAWERRLILYLAIGTIGLFAGRYDIVPALASYLAIQAGLAGRFRGAWAWSILGFLLKLFPAVLWPALLIAEWRQTGRWRWDRLLAAIASGALSIVVEAVFSRHAAFSSYRYFLHRPLEIGSLAAGLSALAAIGHFHLLTSFGSINVVSAQGPLVGSALTVVGLISAGIVLILSVRGRLNFFQTSLALLTIAVLSSKVFSAQYLIWLIPLWARAPLRWQWIAVAVLTTIGYPVTFVLAHNAGSVWFEVAMWVDLARDLMLLWGTLAWLRAEIAEASLTSGRSAWLEPQGMSQVGPPA